MLPLIPALILAASLLSGGAGAMMTADAVAQVNAARDRYNARRSRFDAAKAGYDRSRAAAGVSFARLGKRRLKSFATLSKAVEFLRRARVRDRDGLAKLRISEQQLQMWEMASANAVDVLTGLGKGAAAGVATAAAAYGLVGTLASASTGTAIGLLSGAAAESATLAWLGGGALAAGGGGMALGTFVLGGIVAGPAILVVGFFASAKAEEAKTEVAEQIAELDVAQVTMKQQLAVLKVATKRVRELFRATNEIDKALNELIARSSVENVDEVYAVAQTARALADLLDVALLDTDGNLLTS